MSAAVHRKPLPGGIPPPPPPNPAIREQRIYDQQAPTATSPQQYTHSRTRTTSSSAFPMQTPQAAPLYYGQPPPNAYPQNSGSYPPATRRTLSNATTSTSSTGGVPQRTNSNSSSALERSTSNRSGSSPTGYVALMRKQKATVWSDRAQLEDPRSLAAQRAAKQRAYIEMAHATNRISSSSQSLTTGVRSKIRHHGAPKAVQYMSSTHPATGVPLRLSANEVDEDDSDDDLRTQSLAARSLHQRDGSARSSLTGGYQANVLSTNKSDTAYSPPAEPGSASDSKTSTMNGPDPDETPVPEQFRQAEYFERVNQAGAGGNSSGSGESRENSFGDIGGLPQKTANLSVEDEDELKRRGSVDERLLANRPTFRLFVANPDAGEED